MIIIILIASCLLTYYFIFNIYEVTYSVEPPDILADYASTVEINTVPVNAAGNKVPLRHSFTDFKITAGSDLVDIADENKEAGKLVLRAKGLAGKVIVRMKSKHAILPSSAEINIYPVPVFIEDKGEKNL